MSERRVTPPQHWAYLRLIVIAIGVLGLAVWRFSALPGHKTATLPALLIGMAIFNWLDAWLQGSDRRTARIRDAALLTVVAIVFVVWLR